MKLSDLANTLKHARKEEKHLARTVGQHLAHMIRLYALELWEKDLNVQKQYKDWNSFWKHYSKNMWKKDKWIEKFNDYTKNNLKKAITTEQIQQAINLIIEKKLLDVPTMTPEELAKYHKVSIEQIYKQLEMGIKVEMEHTTDKNIAREIALDHLKEDPAYYTKLAAMEKKM